MTKKLTAAAQRLIASKDPALHVASAPEGYRLKGVSTLTDSDGKAVMQWVKTTRAQEEAAEVLATFRAALDAEPLKAAAKVARPKTLEADLLAMYPMGDPHFGMLAWAPECGEDFDLKIARRLLSEAVLRLVSIMPAAKRAVLLNLGDALHSDSFANTTTKGTRVDVDSRWSKMLQTYLETVIVAVDALLRKHETVHLVNIRGNHDDQSSIVLALCLAAHYRNEPRVIVEPNDSMFWFLEHGQCLIGATHGHTVKAKDLPGLMATDQAGAWGRTKHRQWYCGHVHHDQRKEYPGATVETFRTLAAKDAWHSGQGYRAGRSMCADVWHTTRGRIMRHEIDVGDL